MMSECSVDEGSTSIRGILKSSASVVRSRPRGVSFSNEVHVAARPRLWSNVEFVRSSLAEKHGSAVDQHSGSADITKQVSPSKPPRKGSGEQEGCIIERCFSPMSSVSGSLFSRSCGVLYEHAR